MRDYVYSTWTSGQLVNYLVSLDTPLRTGKYLTPDGKSRLHLQDQLRDAGCPDAIGSFTVFPADDPWYTNFTGDLLLVDLRTKNKNASIA